MEPFAFSSVDPAIDVRMELISVVDLEGEKRLIAKRVELMKPIQGTTGTDAFLKIEVGAKAGTKGLED